MKILDNNHILLNSKDINNIIFKDESYKKMYEFTFYNICFELIENNLLDDLKIKNMKIIIPKNKKYINFNNEFINYEEFLKAFYNNRNNDHIIPYIS